MKNYLQRLWKSEKGFTLIELIIVIAILAIIAAVAVPNILKAVDNSRKTSDITNAKVIADAASQVIAKFDNLSGVTYDATTALNVTSLTGASANADATLAAFEDALFNEFSNGAPDPVYQGGTITEDNYYLVISGGNIQVYVGNNANVTLAANALQLYPTPDASYAND